MPRAYSFSNAATGTASSTLPVATLISTANIRPMIVNIQLSSDTAPNDAVTKYALQRFTAAGTPGSSPAISKLDLAIPAAQTTAGLAVFSVGPTLTANDFPWQQAVYQRAPYNWYARDGYEIILPATAASGVALMALTNSGGAFNCCFGVAFSE